MTAAVLKSWRTNERTSDISDVAPFVAGGLIFGVLAFLFCLVIDVFVMFMSLSFSGALESGIPWSETGLALFSAVTIAISLYVGRRLYRYRMSVGNDGDPMDYDTAVRKRRAFAISSMFVYVLLTPFLWLLMLAFVLSP